MDQEKEYAEWVNPYMAYCLRQTLSFIDSDQHVIGVIKGTEYKRNRGHIFFEEIFKKEEGLGIFDFFRKKAAKVLRDHPELSSCSDDKKEKYIEDYAIRVIFEILTDAYSSSFPRHFAVLEDEAKGHFDSAIKGIRSAFISLRALGLDITYADILPKGFDVRYTAIRTIEQSLLTSDEHESKKEDAEYAARKVLGIKDNFFSSIIKNESDCAIPTAETSDEHHQVYTEFLDTLNNNDASLQVLEMLRFNETYSSTIDDSLGEMLIKSIQHKADIKRIYRETKREDEMEAVFYAHRLLMASEHVINERCPSGVVRIISFIHGIALTERSITSSLNTLIDRSPD